MTHLKKNLRLAFIFVIVLMCSACAAGSPQPGLTEAAPATYSPTILPGASVIPSTPVPSPTPTAVTETPSKTVTAPATQTSTATVTPTQPVKTVNPVHENTPVPQPVAPISVDNANRLSELAIWGNGSANDLAYSPDGNTLAVASSLGIYLYDDNSYRMDTIETGQVVSSLAFSPDGEMLAAGDENGQISLWRWKKKELSQTLESVLSEPITFLAYAPQGNVIGYIQDERNTYIVRIADGKKLVNSRQIGAKSFAFSKDGQGIYYSSDTSVKYFSIYSSQEAIFQIQMTQSEMLLPAIPVFTSALSADGKLLAGGNLNLYLWDTQKSMPLQKLSVVSQSATASYHAPTCNGHFDGWSMVYATTMDISPDNQYIAVGGEDNSIVVVNRNESKLMYATTGYRESIASRYGIRKIAFHPTKPKFITLHANGLIEEYDTTTGRLLEQIASHPQAYTSVAVAPAALANRSLVAIGASNGLTRVYDLAGGKSMLELGWQANALAFSPEGGMLAIGSNDWDIHLVTLADGKQVTLPGGHLDQVISLSFSPDGKTLTSTAMDCTKKVWGFSGNQLIDHGVSSPIPLITISYEDADHAVLSPDGKFRAVGNKHGEIILVDIQTGKDLYWVKAHRAEITSLSFSNDGRILISTSADGTVRLWGVTE
jgi:WD40 repeat protein